MLSLSDWKENSGGVKTPGPGKSAQARDLGVAGEVLGEKPGAWVRVEQDAPALLPRLRPAWG